MLKGVRSLKWITCIKNSCSKLLLYLMRCFPVKRNKLFFFSYYGSQYGCNPKYITEFILRTYPSQTFYIVWAFNHPETKYNFPGVRKVKTMSLKFFYDLCTSKVIITNFRMAEWFLKRPEQYYIQTWHSSLRLKQIEKDAENSLPDHYITMAKKDSSVCDLLLSGCKYSTEIFKRAFWYNGEIFEHGSPRNDLLFQHNHNLKKMIFNRLEISTKNKIVLYAPTFRKNNNLEIYQYNYNILLKTLRQRFGGTWTMLIKLHPHLLSTANRFAEFENVINVTSYDDIQELLAVSDVLISDYSSLIFDYSLTKRPCFLYTPDFEDYIIKDRNLYFDLKELPFISAMSEEDLYCKIISFDLENYKQSSQTFLDTTGSFENGHASKALMNQIEQICFGRKMRGEINEAI